MDTRKKQFDHIFSKYPESQSIESKANYFILRCLFLMIILLLLCWVLNLLNIFIVNTHLMSVGIWGSVLLLLIPFLICKKYGTEKPWIKYVILLFVIMGSTVIGMALTYHTVLISALPLFYSIQYTNKKVVYYTYTLTVMSIFVIVMMGYFYGLCDANMVTLTTETINHYVDFNTGALSFTLANKSPWLTLTLYYVLPRSLFLLSFVPVVQHISNNIAKNAIYTAELQRQSELDDMTGLYNKNKYKKMITGAFPNLKQIGVIFWDINNLKAVNDSLGHTYGDILITSVSSCISEFMDSRRHAFHIGGDEFVLIIEDATDEEILDVLEQWNSLIEKKNLLSKISLSVAVGYAIGNGQDIQTIIQKADESMYLDKQKYRCSHV